ncbi:hypothetical protein ACFPVY_13190 [Flavobacterium qiangtangense]|uniref:Type VI secretion system (T6SS) VasB/ImpH family protein n=1 Tax=Flavobacterium qiangtangense TaxID=1442595 RepID=A0ABW1PQD9_9FLAO
MIENRYFVDNYRHLASFDLRAELLFDMLLKNKTDDLDIVLQTKGVFFRKFSKDFMNVTTDSNDSDILNIDISRDGFYDILPESITHNYRNRDQRNDASQEFKIRKKEEKEARHFYNPLENELFRFRHEIEKYESDFFSKINTNGIADIIRMILGVEDNIPDLLTVKMFYALMKQKGNAGQSVDDISQILEKILGEKVSFTSRNIQLENGHDVEADSSEMIMGITTTLQSNQEIFLKKYNFNIGPLKNPDNLPNYFDEQVLQNFLNTFFNLFLPFQVQYSFEIQLNSEDELFAMDDTIYKSRLGISTVI